MNFINLNESVKTAIRIAMSLAREYCNGAYGAPHLLKAMLHKEIGMRDFLRSMDKDLDYLNEWAEMRMDDYPKAATPAEVIADDVIPDLFVEADNVRLKLGLLEINPICVLTAMARPNIAFTVDQLKSFPIRENEILDLYLNERQTEMAIGASPISRTGEGTDAQPMVNLLKYCIDKTAQAREMRVHGIVERAKETRMMMEILGRHSKPNVMVIGDSGVGKTALVDGLAHDIVNGRVPSHLKGATIYELDLGALIAGATYKGEIEDRLKNIIRELRCIDAAILFIDEVHVLLDSKLGNSGAGNILKPELSRGDFTVIAASTIDEYRKLIEPDHAFNRRFEVLKVEEPSMESAIEMIRSVLPRYAQFHQLEVTDEALEACVRLAKRYDKDRRLPDSAIDLLDRTMSVAKMMNELEEDSVPGSAGQRGTLVGPQDVAAVISSRTGIPIGEVQAQEKVRLLKMEEVLRRRVVGQDAALKSLVDAILESRSGLNKQGQPIGSFFLLGPTGTGKTELAKSLAEALFNDEKAMIRFDMSEFKEEHSAALLYGAPPGYVGYEEGGLLVNKIRQQPYAVVLFDEIEKAHPSVYDIFLQIMDEGKLHDRLGKEGDFSNAIILFTSNVGSGWITEQLNKGLSFSTAQLMEVMGEYFRPEFLARLSEIVPFSPIDETMLLKIFNIQLQSLEVALAKQGIMFDVDEHTRKMLSQKGFTPKYGARQIAGTIRTYLRRPISRMIMGNKLAKGNRLVVSMDDEGELVWTVE